MSDATTRHAERAAAQGDPQAAVQGFPGYYVTRSGRVLSDTGWKGRRVREMAQHDDGRGYLMVRLTKNGRRYAKRVHKLVAEAFCEQPRAGLWVLHKDGDSRNNHAENLYWGTPKENVADTRRHGRLPRGESNGWAKLSAEDVRKIRNLHGRVFHKEIAKMFGISKCHVSDIVNRRQWTHV